MKLVRVFIIGLLLAAVSFSAEMRTWEMADGTQFDAVFVKELFGKLILVEADKTKHVVAVPDLSDLDKKYVRTMVPPTFEVSFKKVSKERERGKAIYIPDEDSFWISGMATIARESQRPYTSRLYAETYVIVKSVESKKFMILSRTDSSFLLTEDNDFTHSYKIPPRMVTKWSAIGGVQVRGEMYEGYIIAIRDFQKNIIHVESRNLPDWMVTKECVNNLSGNYDRGIASPRSRYFDRESNGKKVDPPHPEPYYSQQN